jgi:hypothetical protein
VKRKTIVVRLVVDRRAAKVILAAFAVGTLTMRLSSETLTLATTYPAPVGVYNQLVTTGNSGTAPADTTLARNAGNVILAPATNAGGQVGVGTSAPQAKLDVGGTMRLGGLPADPAGAVDGVLYFNSGTKSLRLFSGKWTDVGLGQGGFCGFASVPGSGNVNIPCQGTALSGGRCPSSYTLVGLGVGVTCVKN